MRLHCIVIWGCNHKEDEFSYSLTIISNWWCITDLQWVNISSFHFSAWNCCRPSSIQITKSENITSKNKCDPCVVKFKYGVENENVQVWGKENVI